MLTIVLVVSFVYAATSDWSPGPPQGNPSQGNVKLQGGLSGNMDCQEVEWKKSDSKALQCPAGYFVNSIGGDSEMFWTDWKLLCDGKSCQSNKTLPHQFYKLQCGYGKPSAAFYRRHMNGGLFYGYSSSNREYRFIAKGFTMKSRDYNKRRSSSNYYAYDYDYEDDYKKVYWGACYTRVKTKKYLKTKCCKIQ